MNEMADRLNEYHTQQHKYRGEDKLSGMARQLHMPLPSLVKEIEAACGVSKGDDGVGKADGEGIGGQATDAAGVAAF